MEEIDMVVASKNPAEIRANPIWAREIERAKFAA